MAGYFDALSNLFSGENLAAATVIGIPLAYSAYESNQANYKAAKTTADAAQRQAQAIQAGNEQAQARFDALQTQAAPGITRLQQVAAAPGGLTPLQQQMLADTRRQTQTQISRSGLRGSGRSEVAAERAVEGDFVNKALASNQQRSDTAATALAAPGLSAYGQQAALDASTGRAVGAADLTAGEAQAGAGIANTQVNGRAIGDIASVIASDAKGRDSRYNDRMAAAEQQIQDLNSRTRTL